MDDGFSGTDYSRPESTSAAPEIFGFGKPQRPVHFPTKVYQLEGHVSGVATAAYTKSEARTEIARLLGLKQLPPGSRVVRIR